MLKYKVVVTDDRFTDYSYEKNILKDINADLFVFKTSSSFDRQDREKDLLNLAYDADALLVNLFPIQRSFINGLQQCKIISRYGVGYDNVDIEAATLKNIWVARVPDYCADEAAEQTIALLFSCARKVVFNDQKIRQGQWNYQGLRPTLRITGKKLGIIGFGSVGQTFFQKIRGFGFKEILIHDPFVTEEIIHDLNAVPAALDALLSASDFISLHTPLTAKTHYLIDETAFAKMKPHAILINTSRGQVIKESALVTALASGQIAYAGIDVFENEPLDLSHPLLAMENIVLSDHFAYYSEESIIDLKTKAAQNVACALSGRRPLYPVNTVKITK